MNNFVKELLLIFLGAFVIYLGALVSFSINWSALEIPITGQSLAVLVVGFLLGRKLGMRAVAVYLLLGIIGLPVFAEGKFGMEILTGGSGGFLYGFLFAAYFIGWLRESGFDKNFLLCLLAMTFGTAVIIAFGVGHLSYLYGFEKALEYGFYPFWQGAIVKIFLGAIIVFLFRKYISPATGFHN